jgi:tRNA A-37 threonylcarbamoyl transferase component Bud32
MNEGSSESKCARCGATVAADAPDGLCPRCLVGLSFVTETEIPGEELGPAGTRVVKPPSPPAPSPAELAPHFPQLEILEVLGRGGMGVVYKARQPKLDRFVALKLLLRRHEDGAGDVAFTERFAREARALARLNHPNIVAVYDYGEAGGYPFLVMEYVEGLTLRQLLQRGKLAPDEALAIVPKICEALQFAHQKGIVHRDIKPENILLDTAGQVKIADFGIAKIIAPGAPDHSLTGAKDVVGTPHYMAPEQVEQPAKVDHRADIYSLGVVFYEMLTGELPLGKFQPPSNKVQIDVRLDEIVLRALAKEPERRYQKASEVKTDVETIASALTAGRGEAGSGPRPETSGKFKTSLLPEFVAGERVLHFKKRLWALWCVALPACRFFFSLPPLWEAGLYITDKRVLLVVNLLRLLTQEFSIWFPGRKPPQDREVFQSVSTGKSPWLGEYLTLESAAAEKHWYRSQRLRVRLYLRQPESLRQIVSEQASAAEAAGVDAPATGQGASQPASPPPAVIRARKKRKGEFLGIGAAVQAIGLVCFFIPNFGLLLGIGLLLIGGRMALKLICSHCGNHTTKTARICTACGAHFETPQGALPQTPPPGSAEGRHPCASGPATAARWAARILGTAWALMLLLFVVGEGSPALGQQPVRVQVEFAAMGLMVLGFMVGWWRDGPAALLTLAGWTLFHLAEQRLRMWSLFHVSGVVGVLYGISWLARRRVLRVNLKPTHRAGLGPSAGWGALLVGMILGFLWLANLPPRAGTFRCVVTDAVTGTPVANARVIARHVRFFWPSATRTSLTDADGRCQLPAWAGRTVLEAEAAGYAPSVPVTTVLGADSARSWIGLKGWRESQGAHSQTFLLWPTSRAAASAPLAWGPEVDRVVSQLEADDQGYVFLSLKTGQRFKPPSRLLLRSDKRLIFPELTPELQAWIRSNGVNLLLHLENGEWSLETLDMLRAVPPLAEAWDRVDSAKVAAASAFLDGQVERVRRGEVTVAPVVFSGLRYDDRFSRCEVMRTRQDETVLWQWSGLNTNPRGVKLRYKMVQPMFAAERPAQPAAFGDTMDVQVLSNERMAKAFLDLDTGEVLNAPVELADHLAAGTLTLSSAEILNWMRSSGADVMCQATRPPLLLQMGGAAGLAGMLRNPDDGKTVAKHVDQVTVDEVTQFARGIAPQAMKANPQLMWNHDPATANLFETREGGMGVLEITGFTENPPGVKVRYRLVQAGKMPASAPTNHLSGIARATQAVVHEQVATKLAAMKSRLRLTEEQEQAVRALLEKKLGLAGELSTKMTEGGLSKEEMDKADRTIQAIDWQLKEILTPEQWADYEASQTEERRTQAQLAANVEVMELQPMLHLSQPQRDQVLGILTRLHEQQLAKTYDGLKIPLDWEQQLTEIKDALRPALTGEQIQSLEKWLDLQRETIKATLSKSTISNSSMIPKQASPAS